MSRSSLGIVVVFFFGSFATQTMSRSGCTMSVNTARLLPDAFARCEIGATVASRTESQACAATTVANMMLTRARRKPARYHSGLIGFTMSPSHTAEWVGRLDGRCDEDQTR